MIGARVTITSDKRPAAHAHLGPAGLQAFLDHLADELLEASQTWAKYYIYDTPEGSYVRTWNLFNTLRKKRAGLHRFMVESGVYYALWVHEGTKTMSARPYLVQALKEIHRKTGALGRDHFRSIR